jgi:hypothetical protein
MTGFGGGATGFVAGATAATGLLGGALVIAVFAVGLRAGDLATLALLAGAFVAEAASATGFLGWALAIAVLAVGLRAGDLATLALLAGAFVAEAASATGFLGGALVIAALAVGLRAGDLATLALLAGAFLAGARFAAIVWANFFAADFFFVFFAAATFFMFFAFFAIIVSLIVAADFPNHTRQSNQISSQGVMELYGCLLNCVPSIALDRRIYDRNLRRGLHRDG